MNNELITANGLANTNMAMMKMENESIQSHAMAKPRDIKAIKDDIKEQIDHYPAFAEKMVYARPVGIDQKTGKQKIARGLSIRAAEALAEAYGFNRIRCEADDIDDDKVRITATFTDLQRGRIWQDVGIVSKNYKSRYGKMERFDDHRFYSLVLKSEMSKRVREVILRCISAGLKEELRQLAEQYMAKMLSGEGVSKIVDRFAELNVDIPKLESYVGRPIGNGWTDDDRVTLLSTYNAIKDGVTTVKEVFGAKKEVEEGGTSLEQALKQHIPEAEPVKA